MLSYYQNLLARLSSFEERFQLSVPGNPIDYLKSALKEMPQLIYYISGIRCSSCGNQTTYDITYHHQEVPMDQIHVVRSNLRELIVEAVSRYQLKLVLITENAKNMKWELDAFREQLVSYYPNCTGYSCSISSFQGMTAECMELTLHYRIGTVKLRTMEIEVNNEIERLRKLLFPIAMPDSAKCVIAHNYLASTITYYDEDHGSNLERSYVQSAYGALIRKLCVCQGYAEAFKRIMDAENIPCNMVCGKAGFTREEHAWNQVKVSADGPWSHIDVTWDSKAGKAGMKHLFKGDSFYAKKREWNHYYYAACREDAAAFSEAKQFLQLRKRQLLALGLHNEWLM